MQGVATERPAGVLEQYVENREGAQHSRQAYICLRSRTLVRSAGSTISGFPAVRDALTILTLLADSTFMDVQQRTDRGTERRRRPTPALSVYLFRRRRRRHRRSSDAQVNYYVDRVSPEARLVTLVLAGLSTLDAILSLRLFAIGEAGEMNPLLNLALQYGSHTFLAVKLALTLFAIFTVLLHWNFIVFRKLTVAVMAYTLIGLYTALILYEILLLIR